MQLPAAPLRCVVMPLRSVVRDDPLSWRTRENMIGLPTMLAPEPTTSSRRAKTHSLPWILVALSVSCRQPSPAFDAFPARVQVPIAAAASSVLGPAATPSPLLGTCVIVEHDLESLVALRLTPGGPAIATLQAPPRLALKLSPSTGGDTRTLKASGNGIELRTPWVQTELPLRPRRPVALFGILTPLAHRSFDWLSAQGSTARIGYQAGEHFDALRLETHVPCADLSLKEPLFEAKSLGQELPETSRGFLRQGVELLVGATPTAPDPVRLQLSTVGDGEVTIHGTHGSKVQVRYETSDEVLIGWVEASSVSRTPPMLSGIGFGGAGSGYGHGMRAKSPINWVVCHRETELYGEISGVRAIVGTLRPGARFEPGGHRDGWVEVDFWLPWIHPAKPGAFVLTEAALEQCKVR